MIKRKIQQIRIFDENIHIHNTENLSTIPNIIIHSFWHFMAISVDDKP